ncbi:MAG: choice-of-anchor I family protein [Bacteroidia bacterium]|nr:choice-of-anchor I family protein [Bacteroidia bacterium]
MTKALRFLSMCAALILALGRTGAQTTGDLAFTGFNADGTDGFAFVTFVDIPANTPIWFTDEEWNGTAFGTGEGDVVWSNPAITPAGTVVYLSAVSTAAPAATLGTAALGTTPAAGPNLSGTDEGLYAYLGAQRAPTVFLSAIANAAWGGAPGQLTNTGLTAGATAFELPSAIDIGAYNAPRNNQPVFSQYLAQVYSTSNWITQDGGGNQDQDGTQPDIPFDTAPFTLSSGDVAPPVATAATMTSLGTFTVAFSETVDPSTATNLSNYAFAPALTITGAVLNTAGTTVTLTAGPGTIGVFYTLTVSGVQDTAGNTMTNPASFTLVFNNSTPQLVFTEIMYDEPSDSDSLDFVEIFNAGLTPAVLGGLRVTNGISYTFPQTTLAPGATYLIAANDNAAVAFYGASFDQYAGAVSNGGETFDIVNTDGTIVETVTYDDVAPWPLGPPNPNGDGPSIEVIDPYSDNNNPANWKISGNLIGTSNAGEPIFATPGTVTLATSPLVSFTTARQVVSETAGTVTVGVGLTVPNFLSAEVEVALAGFATAGSGDFAFTADTLVFAPGAADTLFITIPVTNDSDAEQDEYFALKLTPLTNADPGGVLFQTIYITDDDRLAPAPSQEIALSLLGSYSNGAASGNSAEIVAFDAASDRLFIANSIGNKLDIVDFTNPAAPAAVTSVDLDPYGEINSAAAYNGLIAVALGNDTSYLNGTIAFFDTNGVFLKQVTAGALPDMITFTPDGQKVLTANEGEPSANYLNDPEGSVTIVDLSGGIAGLTQANVSTATFTAFNGQEAALRAAGIRIFGPNATAAQDFEPEYIALSPDGATAWVTLQENNAVAVLNVNTATITSVLPLGYKDHSLPGNGLDGSNSGSDILISNYPVKGMYLPDAIASFQIGGQTYLITANEGDARDYDGYSEESQINGSDYPLDSAAFPSRDLLRAAIGPLKTTLSQGDTDNDGDFDEIYVFGGRSFTIWNGATGALVYDSGDHMELITEQDPVFSAIFNASNTNNTRKNRSDDKGPEPEGVVTGVVNGNTYAFVALERIGGVMVFNVNNPAAPVFVQYVNNRSTTAVAGDRGAEGIIFVPAAQSPNGKNLVIVANEISSTLSVFEIDAVELEQYQLFNSPLITSYNGIDIREAGFSGLHYIPGTDGEFLVHGDRGPNVSANANPLAAGQTVILFPQPAYVPKVHRVKAQGDSLQLMQTWTIKRPDGTGSSGLPNPAGQGGTGEIAWSDNNGTVVAPDVWGIDPEGIVEAPDGTYWICEEYGVTVWHLDENFQVIDRYTPYGASPDNLPIDSVFKKRRANRGFEGVALTPNGKVYAFIQSPMNNPGATAGNNSRLIRILELDPATGSTRMFGYEFQPPVGGSGGIRTRDWKLGDAAAINNFEFLVLEHAERGAANVKEVYKVDIRNATPLTSDNFGGLTFEQLLDAQTAAANGVQVVEKTRYLDLLRNGWDLTHDKPEGLTIIDPSTIAVVNDNDFGIASPNEDGNIVATGRTTKLYRYTIPASIQEPLDLCRAAVVTASADSVCEGTAVTLSVTPVDGAGYTWRNGTTVLSAAAPTVSVTESGLYTVEITGVPECASVSPAVAVQVLEAPAIALGNDTTICVGGSVTLNAGAGFASYAWSTGAATPGITLAGSSLAAGPNEIRVTALTAEGCEARDTVTVRVEVCSSVDPDAALALSVFPNPARTLVQIEAEGLQAGTVLVRMTTPDGREVYSRRVAAAASFRHTVPVSVLPAGIYLLQVTDGIRSGWSKISVE